MREHSEDAAGEQSLDAAGDQSVEDATDAGGPTSEPPVTGEPAVDDTLRRLSEIDDLPTADHVDLYDEVHQRLSDILADRDEG